MTVGDLRCSECGGDELYRSRRRFFERWLSLFGRFPFRCATCSHRALYPITAEQAASQIRTGYEV